MPELNAASIVLVVVASLFTAAAAVWDVSRASHPEQADAAGFCPWAGCTRERSTDGTGLADAGLGFLLGFGTLFVLWVIGGGGGGDVKLMGALSVWLGFQLTLLVVICSTAIVLLATFGFIVVSVFSGNFRKTAKKHLATGKDQTKRQTKERETTEEKQGRRVMAYAVPVAVATWMVLIWKLPTLP